MWNDPITNYSFHLLKLCEDRQPHFSNCDQVFHTPSLSSASLISPVIDLPSIQPCRWPRNRPRYRPCHRHFIYKPSTLLDSQATPRLNVERRTDCRTAVRETTSTEEDHTDSPLVYLFYCVRTQKIQLVPPLPVTIAFTVRCFIAAILADSPRAASRPAAQPFNLTAVQLTSHRAFHDCRLLVPSRLPFSCLPTRMSPM